jgi:hypothetical protein
MIKKIIITIDAGKISMDNTANITQFEILGILNYYQQKIITNILKTTQKKDEIHNPK